MIKTYITDLAAYNNGHLIGEWVALPMDEDDLRAKITQILATGAQVCEDDEHEEIFITDFECDFMEIGEYSDPFQLNEIAEQAENLSYYEFKAVKFLLKNYLVKDFNEALEKYEEVIIHEDSSMEDLAYEYVNECYGIDSLPAIIANNIDYEKIGRELELDGRYYEEDGDIFEFS
ncbi:antirestriction protein ArdA [Sulfurimonas sp.]|uniref:antirestriction protein ArdA n=1 Tax=Sulfurimonas sp. TaxID=2022749 RepID=UPI0025D63A3A|nr:antirestriction protein ArdA [Sulfurimonas sp.]